MDIFNIVMFSIVGLWLLVASCFDFKNREVPDWLNFSLFAAAIASRLMAFVYTWEFSYLIQGLFGFLIGLVIGFAMSYTKQWGDGDSKLIVGISTGIGFSFFNFFDLSNWPFLFVFFINSLIAGAVYGIIWGVVLGIIKFNDIKKGFSEIGFKFLFYPAIFGIICFLIVFVFFNSFFVLFIPLILILVFSMYLLVYVNVVQKRCMYKKQEINKLVPGDWIAETISIKGKVICSKKDRCLDEGIIKLLRKNKIKFLLIKEGIPFVPAFLFGFIITLIFGNVLRWLI